MGCKPLSRSVKQHLLFKMNQIETNKEKILVKNYERRTKKSADHYFNSGKNESTERNIRTLSKENSLLNKKVF